jgi:hypothetical protein
MTSDSSDEGASIAAAHDFSGYRRIVDVGGGHGALLAAVLNRYPGPVGVLFDLPEVVATAHGAIDRHIAAGRVEKLAGDFSEAVPPGGDAYLLKWIVHDWDDEAAIRILTNCRTVMPPAGKVLLVEVVISPRHGWFGCDPLGHHNAGLHRQPGTYRAGVSRTAPSRRPDTPRDHADRLTVQHS